MDKIWAPWRIKYVQDSNKNDRGCIFCRIYKEKKDHKNFIIYRSTHCFTVLNLFPYNNGHLMIVLNRHLGSTEELNQQELLDISLQVKKTITLLRKTLNPGGFNVGMNVGKDAGAGIADHLHIHIVPRWGGDTNFMPVTSNTKVISQGLEDLYQQLKKCLQEKK